MFKRFMLILVILLFFVVTSYAEEWSKTGQYLAGDHLLKSIQTIVSKYSEADGGFFWLFGSYKSESGEERTVTFAWLNNQNEYVITTLPLEKIRVRIDNSNDKPYVKFKWRPCNLCNPIDCIIYALIVCNDEQWNPKFEMLLE